MRPLVMSLCKTSMCRMLLNQRQTRQLFVRQVCLTTKRKKKKKKKPRGPYTVKKRRDAPAQIPKRVYVSVLV